MKHCIAARNGFLQRCRIAQVSSRGLSFEPFEIFQVASLADKQAYIRTLVSKNAGDVGPQKSGGAGNEDFQSDLSSQWVRGIRNPHPILLCRVMGSAEKMKGNVWFVADDPTIVAGRSWRDIEEHSRTKFVDRAVFHCSGRAAGEHHPNMFHITTRGADTRTHMKGPLPSRLIC